VTKCPLQASRSQKVAGICLINHLNLEADMNNSHILTFDDAIEKTSLPSGKNHSRNKAFSALHVFQRVSKEQRKRLKVEEKLKNEEVDKIVVLTKTEECKNSKCPQSKSKNCFF
jgi:hypothetical protein